MTDPSPDTAPARSAWRAALSVHRQQEGSGQARALALGVELRERESAHEAHWGPRGVRTLTPRAFAQGPGEIHLGARPLVRSETGAWIKGDVTWEGLRRDTGSARAEHRRWMLDLYVLGQESRTMGRVWDSSEWLSLDQIDSALLWAHLHDASRRGIAIIGVNAHTEVALAPEAEVSVQAGPSGRDMVLRPIVTLGSRTVSEGSFVRPVGRTGVYVVTPEGAGLGVTLAPATLGSHTAALLRHGSPVVVPAHERADFFAEAYPTLARETRVVGTRGVRLPAPETITLVVTVSVTEKDAIDYRLSWNRPGLPRVAYDALEDGDDAAEHLRERVERDWPTFAERAFSPTGRLRGIDAAVFVTRALPGLELIPGVRVEGDALPHRYRELSGDPRIRVRVMESDDRDWFDMGIHVEIDGRRIPFTPLFRALALRRKRLMLSDGAHFSLTHPALERLRELIDEAADLPEWEAGPRVSRYQVPWWSEFEDLADDSDAAQSWRDAVRALSIERGEQIVDEPDEVIDLPAGLDAPLRSYQREGFERLALLWRFGLGGVLADDMGLGKTLQVLALMVHVRENSPKAGAFLVVAPTSVTAVWRAEARRCAPGLRVVVVDHLGQDISAIDADVVVTTYTVLRRDHEAFAAREWAGVVLDEAQFVKNPRTALYRAVQSLRARATYAVTGTPLENSLDELWAILSLTCPGLFASGRRFRDEYVLPIEKGGVEENQVGGAGRAERLARLRRRIRPFVVRRTKALVAPELPERQEQEVRVELGTAHRAIYDRALQRERRKILGLLDDVDRNKFIVFRSLTLLRRLALSPELVGIDDGPIRSTKLDALIERLDQLAREGRRALVFSQFTSYLDIVQTALDAHGTSLARLDGSTTKRDEVIDRFRTGEAQVFLISLKAGGFGVTLTEADCVFLMDPWWNPAAEAQAIDRTHRIGQDRPVHVYRMIAAGTIEEKVVELQHRKRELFQSVMDDGDGLAEALTADDIRGLLGA